MNSGLGLTHRDSIRWDEEFLALPDILNGHFWRIEQTPFALCSSRHGVELLPMNTRFGSDRALVTAVFGTTTELSAT
jgi:hypothetical protein